MSSITVGQPHEIIRPLAISLFEEWPRTRREAASITNHLIGLYDDMDRQADQMLRVREHIACKAGCAWCCYQPVGITAFEAFLIADGLDNHGTAKEQHNIRMQAAHVRKARRKNRQPVRQPCAFLTDQNTCSIYPARPLRCRGYTSLDVQACIKNYDTQKRKPGQNVSIPVMPDHFSLHIFVIMAIHLASIWHGYSAGHLELELATAVDTARKPDTFARWLNRELVFEPMNDPEKQAQDMLVMMNTITGFEK